MECGEITSPIMCVPIPDASPMEIENFIETIYGVNTTHNQDFASDSETEGFHGFTESEMEAAVESCWRPSQSRARNWSL